MFPAASSWEGIGLQNRNGVSHQRVGHPVTDMRGVGWASCLPASPARRNICVGNAARKKRSENELRNLDILEKIIFIEETLEPTLTSIPSLAEG